MAAVHYAAAQWPHDANNEQNLALNARQRACAVMATCLEPGMRTLFEEASPTFKRRFMYMSGFTNEGAFDAIRATLAWEGHAERIRAPYLCVAGEADELSPLEHAERLMRALACPKRLVVCQDRRHSARFTAAQALRNREARANRMAASGSARARTSCTMSSVPSWL